MILYERQRIFNIPVHQDSWVPPLVGFVGTNGVRVSSTEILRLRPSSHFPVFVVNEILRGHRFLSSILGRQFHLEAFCPEWGELRQEVGNPKNHKCPDVKRRKRKGVVDRFQQHTTSTRFTVWTRVLWTPDQGRWDKLPTHRNYPVNCGDLKCKESRFYLYSYRGWCISITCQRHSTLVCLFMGFNTYIPNNLVTKVFTGFQSLLMFPLSLVSSTWLLESLGQEVRTRQRSLVFRLRGDIGGEERVGGERDYLALLFTKTFGSLVLCDLLEVTFLLKIVYVWTVSNHL